MKHRLHRLRALVTMASLLCVTPRLTRAQQEPVVVARGDSVTVRLVDVDLRAAVQALSRYIDRPVVFSGPPGVRVTLEAPRPVARGDITRLLRGLLESQNMELVADSAAGIYRLRTRDAARPATPSPASPPMGMRTSALELFVIHLRHAKASEVAATVNALYGRAAAFGELGDRSRSTLSRDLTQQQASAVGDAPSQAVASVVGRAATLGGEVTIVPDVRVNSLLIRASRTDFALIQAAVGELDVRPLQVLVEVMIAEVRRDRALSFGVAAALSPAIIARGTNTTIEATTAGAGLSDFVVKIMGISNAQLQATISAAASRGDATIVSRPILLAANNEKAEINVGSQRPFVQVARVLPTDNTARDQVVQYKDVGTRLSITPTISADGYIMLQVVQEVNAATAEQAFNAPIISTRSVETRLLVKDRQTIVLGGITDRQREHSQAGVPFLSALPWVGGLFGHISHQNVETELFLFLTPRIITSDADVESVTTPFEQRAHRIEHE
jgi:general secretion pathway protein D